MDLLLVRTDGGYALTPVRDDGAIAPSELVADEGVAARVAELDAPTVRWVWADTRTVYPPLLSAGIRVHRCVDLRLAHAILRRSAWTTTSALAAGPDGIWDAAITPATTEPTLLDEVGGLADVSTGEVRAEYDRQRAALDAADHPGRLQLLTTAESVGGLIAAEMRHVGMPFDVGVHDQQLTGLLGPRPLRGGRPAVVEDLVGRLRMLLGAPSLNPESQPALLRALVAAGIEVTSTRQWELEHAADHPAIPVLLEYKKLSRLLSANGWLWADTWVRGGRFRPDYLPGGVVTGRWATQGGGALQLPRQVRAAVRADPGWRLVVADAAQLEPRVLAAMSADQAMARAGRGHDLYAELVASGVVPTRPQAKVAMLGALYGATSGEAGELMPALLRAYPAATGLVEQAARDGERGRQVTTWLGRTSPVPGEWWRSVQQRAHGVDATAADERAARRQSRDWGRFTRNFVVQGSAAEWALCWLAAVRRDLHALASAADETGRPQLVYFLHDEIMVHTPADLADDVVAIVRRAAAEAGRLMFGAFPVEFPVTPVVVESYADAK